jgi:hypothetical protein
MKKTGMIVALVAGVGAVVACSSATDGGGGTKGDGVSTSDGGTTSRDGSTAGSVLDGGVSESGLGALTGATAVSFGGLYACAVLANETAACWGENSVGQLGNGTTTSSLVPVTVSGLANVSTISAAVTSATNDSTGGIVHTCAVLSDGTVHCWGGNEYGQLGSGSTATSLVPVAVTGITGAVTVSAGTFHSCAVLIDGTVKCWGRNSEGELGNGSTIDSPTPVTVTGLAGATSVSAGNSGSDAYSCAVLNDGTVRCWGYAGKLGSVASANSPAPVTVSGITGATSVSARNAHACAVAEGGTVLCWGYNADGELGNGSTTDSLTPVVANGITDATSVTTGAGGTCALLTGGAIWCWGGNNPVPAAVMGLGPAKAVSYGVGGACVLLDGGSIECWGDNTYGELGNGTTTSSATPVAVGASH